MLENSKSNKTNKTSLENPEAFKNIFKLEIKENPNSELSKFVKKTKDQESAQIEKLRQELGAPNTEKLPITEKEVSQEEIANRISTEKVVEEISRKQREKAERYDMGPEELGILAWEDKVIEAQKNVDIAESRLNLSEEEFKEMFGEMTPDMQEAISRMLERNKKLVEEYTNIAKGLREKLKEKQDESK